MLTEKEATREVRSRRVRPAHPLVCGKIKTVAVATAFVDMPCATDAPEPGASRPD